MYRSSITTYLTVSESTIGETAPLSLEGEDNTDVFEDAILMEDRVQCPINCARLALLDHDNDTHACNTFKKPINGFCVFGPGGDPGEGIQGYDAGGFCRSCLTKVI